MRGLLLLSILVTSALFLTGCGVVRQADIPTDDLETQPIPTATSLTILTMTTAKPAAFSVSDLTIEPRTLATGEYFIISVTVTNTGNSQGSYDAILYIEEINTVDPKNVVIVSTVTFTKSVTIAAGESKKRLPSTLLLYRKESTQ